MWVVGHFHLTMAAASFLGSLAAIYYWFPKMFGRNLNEGLGKAHFWTSVVLITVVFVGQIVSGYAGHQRRLYDPYQYTFLTHLRPLNQWVSFFGFGLGVSQLLFAVNFLKGVFAGSKAEINPWQVGTLEWTAPSPPPHHNYDVIPVVLRGPHELSDPEIRERLGRDWVGQTEELPPKPPAEEAKATA